MYGFTPSADHREARQSAAGQQVERLRTAALFWRNYRSCAWSTPGTGTWARNRKTIRIPRTKSSRRRMSGARKALSRDSNTVATRRRRAARGLGRRRRASGLVGRLRRHRARRPARRSSARPRRPVGSSRRRSAARRLGRRGAASARRPRRRRRPSAAPLGSAASRVGSRLLRAALRRSSPRLGRARRVGLATVRARASVSAALDRRPFAADAADAGLVDAERRLRRSSGPRGR